MHDNAIETRNAYQTIVDHLPMPVLLMDADARIHLFNSVCRPLFPPHPETVYQRKFGEALHCIHSAEGCGLGTQCHACPIRDAIATSERGVKATRNFCEITVVRGNEPKTVSVLVTVSPMRFVDGLLHVVVLEDVTELHELRAIIPMCASCKMIRCEDGSWEQIESYLHRNSNAALAHGLCPECEKSQMRKTDETPAPPAGDR